MLCADEAVESRWSLVLPSLTQRDLVWGTRNQDSAAHQRHRHRFSTGSLYRVS